MTWFGIKWPWKGLICRKTKQPTKIQLSEIELFDHLTVRKQMTNV